MFVLHRVHCWFALFAIAGFGLQGLVSNTGALSVIFVDLPFPIPYINGRTFHVNVSLYWTFAGLLSGIFYLLAPIKNKRTNQFASILFLLYSLGTLLTQGMLALHFTVGREYLEGPRALRAFLLVPLLMMIYYLVRILPITVKQWGRIIPVSIVTGMVMLTAFYAGTVYYYTNPALGEYHRFLTFHIGIEISVELISLGITGLLLIKLAGIERQEAAFVVFSAAGIAVLTVLAAGVGYAVWPGIWLAIVVAGIGFSALHMLAAIAFFSLLSGKMRDGSLKNCNCRSMISLVLIASSLLYHIVGAGVLGLFLAYPGTHQYIHGTYIVSAHSHLAVFGVFGFLALAVSIYILLEFVQLTKKESRRCLGGILLLHGGMLIMSTSLIIAGGLQTYFLRILNMDMSVADTALRPYLFLRIGGGISYMLGSLLVAYTILKAVWLQRAAVFGQGGHRITPLYELYSGLLRKQKETVPLMQRILYLQRVQQVINIVAKRIK